MTAVRKMPLAPLVGCFGVFVTMGLLVSTLGPLLPGIRAEFGVGPQDAGLLVSAVPLGCIAGTLIVLFFLNRRFHARVLLAATGVTMAVGLVGAGPPPPAGGWCAGRW